MTEPEKKKEVEPFLAFQRPFGLEQHVFNSINLGAAHALTVYKFWLDYEGGTPNTFWFELLYGYVGGLGITVGCHRYWTHRTFKANLPLQILLMICQTISLQLPIRKWCLDHRIHHKFTDTNKDPHNSKRGFWFSHIWWLVLPKHPELKKELETFEVPDLDNDPVVRFQSKWFWPLTLVFHIIVPILIMQYFWPEITLLQCLAADMRRYVISLHITYCVNSVAHMWGDKPYDENISAVESPIVSFLAIGEGWHNFHHTFPWDYKTSEFGWKFNVSTVFIDFMAWIGWAYDLKTVSPQIIQQRVARTGPPEAEEASTDSNSNIHEKNHSANEKHENDQVYQAVKEWIMESEENPVWGWNDERIPQDLRNATKILNVKTL
ncbi:unnamed protein product [Orchesella dallaii]|uniref:Fatty acid desaturase domain-containing protein n=1 Tax=Orchesella dallaii TaxID=48710 RepID=A0ABP1RLJ8_9HEXA